MTRILVLGSTGQVGWELQRALAPLGKVIALDRRGSALNGVPLRGDLASLDALALTVSTVRPEAVINAAAYTGVDKAETDRSLAEVINAHAPGVLANECARIGSLLVHYSTDYVFDGSGDRPWREDDPPRPLNAYGRTKLEGEERIRASGVRHVILRTSWVYAARGANFVRTMLRLASERDAVNVVNDQFGVPTGAELLADLTAHILLRLRGLADDRLTGTYHVAPDGTTTWFDYARLIIEQARATGWPVKVPANAITPIPTSAYPLPAARPHNSRLDCRKLKQVFELRLPPWQDGVRRAVSELIAR